MADSIRTSWLGILSWLDSEAPLCRAAIKEPTPPREVDSALSEIGVDTPDFLRDWWLLHNGIEHLHGTTIFPGRFWPLGVQEMLDLRQLHLSIAAGVGGEILADSNNRPAGENAIVFPQAFVPLAMDGTGCVLALDLRGGDRNGCIKIFDRDEGALLPPISPTFPLYLQGVLDVLSGRMVGPWEPYGNAGWIDWIFTGS